MHNTIQQRDGGRLIRIRELFEEMHLTANDRNLAVVVEAQIATGAAVDDHAIARANFKAAADEIGDRQFAVDATMTDDGTII